MKYGFWHSPLGAEALSCPPLQFQELGVREGELFWTESRPLEKGRQALMHLALGGEKGEVDPSMSVQSRVNEYGGGSFSVFEKDLIFFDALSSGLYLQREDEEKICLISDPRRRFADFSLAPDRRRLLSVCEEHKEEGKDPDHYLVEIDCQTKEITIINRAHSFYASPRFSPEGRQVAFLSWDQSCMPWESCTLRIGTVQEGVFCEEETIGASKESIPQFLWLKEGELVYASDRTGFWNLYHKTHAGERSLHPMEADSGMPLWVLGRKPFVSCFWKGRQALLLMYTKRAIDHLALITIDDGVWQEIPLPYTLIRTLDVAASSAFLIAGGPKEEIGIVQLDLESFSVEPLIRASQDPLDYSFGISVASEVSALSLPSMRVYGFYYPPVNREYKKHPVEPPPLIMRCHGGPTSHATTQLNWEVQFWTSRGFAFCDVNYRGSTGFGRTYRDALLGGWGDFDVQDALHLAMELVLQGKANQDALFVKGSSSGGFTALCLAASSLFRGCVSYYGVTDLLALSQESHKFERGYLGSLMGKAHYEERSPLSFAKQITCPVLFFHGEGDRIVPLSQAQRLAEQLEEAELVVFPGEGHSFRQASTIRSCLERELLFYQRQLSRMEIHSRQMNLDRVGVFEQLLSLGKRGFKNLSALLSQKEG